MGTGSIATFVALLLASACATTTITESYVDVVSAIHIRDGAFAVTTCAVGYTEKHRSASIAVIVLSGGKDDGSGTKRSADMGGCVTSRVGELQHVVLTRYAHAAARAGDCASVRVYARRVHEADPAYFERALLRDATTAACLVRNGAP